MKTDPLKSRPTTLKEPEALVMNADPVKDGGNVTSSSTNFATFNRAGTDTLAAATCWPERLRTVI